jgi:uncharacterized protein
MKTNPFKFGTVVDDPFFTDRTEELVKIADILQSHNHLIIISPRRYGKTSLIRKAIQTVKRKVLMLDLQLINSPEDLAAQYLRRIYRIFPGEKIRQLIKNFRIIPAMSLNPVTNEVEVSFEPSSTSQPYLEDVFDLLEKISNENQRTIVILDEFQEIERLGSDMGKKLRSIMQYHKNINYVFLGSQESMMHEIFEKKKSSFYHFGIVLTLPIIKKEDFSNFLCEGLKEVINKTDELAYEILNFTGGHPYYTQQLAFAVWNILHHDPTARFPAELAIQETIHQHDLDYEHLWETFNSTDRKLMIGMTHLKASPLSSKFLNAIQINSQSTVFSSLKKLSSKGIFIRTNKNYEFDDPFFKLWIIQRRAM